MSESPVPENTGDNKTSLSPGLLTEEEKAERQRRFLAFYEKRLSDLQRSGDPTFKLVLGLCSPALLDETNLLGVHRLLEIFGPVNVEAKVKEALALHHKAASSTEQSPPFDNGTATAAKNGQLRSKGGVFFFLMREQAAKEGKAWENLRIPSLPFNRPLPDSLTAAIEQCRTKNQSGQVGPTVQPPQAAQVTPAADPAEVEPSPDFNPVIANIFGGLSQQAGRKRPPAGAKPAKRRY
jgi:hypothetical protein